MSINAKSIKALSLLQPWASLWAAQIDKHYETRNWPLRYSGPLAIHASKSFKRDIKEMCLEEPFREALVRAGIKTFSDIPLGAVIAVCDRAISYRTSEIGHRRHWYSVPTTVGDHEREFGDYSPGRFYFEAINMRLLPEPVPARGELGLWTWYPPAEVVEWLESQGVKL